MERAHLDWFRSRIAISVARESGDCTPLLAWRESLISQIKFSASLIGLDEVKGWRRETNGNVVHNSGQFFSIEGVRIVGTTMREVTSWDQPIYNQPEGGMLVLVAREHPDHGVQFLLQAKAEPGNIGWLQFCPTIQSTWSNFRQAHKGRRPPLSEIIDASEKKEGVRTIYEALHNEEGGRFWRKSNANMILFIERDDIIASDITYFQWATLSQIKELALLDNLLSPFVKTIVAPL
jgi:dTDP-4-dehydro-6-deoxy-alpha-D-glucopyranose 2,3-dehydratase